jgi:hypothetical protein
LERSCGAQWPRERGGFQARQAYFDKGDARDRRYLRQREADCRVPKTAAEAVVVGVIARTRHVMVARERGLIVDSHHGKAQRVLAKCRGEVGIRRRRDRRGG